MIRETLLAIRQTAIAQVAMCDALLRAVESEPEAAATDACSHPADRRVSASRMGAPNAFVCGQCREEIG